MGSGIGGLFSLRQNGEDYFYLYDGKGKVTTVVDSSQQVVATYQHNAFGRLMSTTGSLEQPMKSKSKHSYRKVITSSFYILIGSFIISLLLYFWKKSFEASLGFFVFLTCYNVANMLVMLVNVHHSKQRMNNKAHL